MYTYVLTIVRLDLDSTNVYTFVLTIAGKCVSLDYHSTNVYTFVLTIVITKVLLYIHLYLQSLEHLYH